RVGRRSPRWASALDDALAGDLCVEGDDLPLAVEIIASNAAVVGPSVVLESLRRGAPLPLEVHGPARHRTLDAAVAATFEQLGPPLVDLLTRLAVVEGALRLDAAEAVLGVDEAAEPLARLAHATAIAVDDTPSGTRFRLLAIVRSFARRRLPVPTDPVLERLVAFLVARMESGDRDPGIDAVAVRQLAAWLRLRPAHATDRTRRLGALLRAARGVGDRDLALGLGDEAFAIDAHPGTLAWRAARSTLCAGDGDPDVAVQEEPRSYVCALAHRWADPTEPGPVDAVERFRRWASTLDGDAAICAAAGADLLESRSGDPVAADRLTASAASRYTEAGAHASAGFVEVRRARASLAAGRPEDARSALARASASLARAPDAPALRFARQAVDCAREGPEPGVVERAEALLRRAAVDSHLDHLLDRAAAHLDPRREIDPGEAFPDDDGLIAERDAFVGREDELADLARRFASGARLITVSGIGGSGKTRLALRYGRTSLADWPGGVRFCDLSDAVTLDGVLHAVAQALQCGTDARDPVGSLGRAIAARGRSLLILDNFEQVAEHAGATVGRWMDRAPEAAFLVTSRERLGLDGEASVVVPPLPLASARALFLLRAAAVNPTFEPGPDPEHGLPSPAGRSDDPIGALARLDALLNLLDRLPLAIELAAARLRVMSVDEVHDRMIDRFRLLVASGRRTDRQATLRATLDGSWDLLTEEAQDGLARLAVFEGGFDLPAAEAVMDVQVGWPLDVVRALVDASMVQTAGGRFHLLNSVRDYAHERLVERGGRRAAEALHGAWFARYVRTDNILRRGRGSGWSARAANLDNLVAACRRAIDRDDPDVAIATLECTVSVVQVAGPFGIGLELAERVLRMESLPMRARAIARYFAGKLTFNVGRLDRSVELCTAALAEARAVGDPLLEARTLVARGVPHAIEDRLDEARADYEAALAIYEASDAPSNDLALTLCNLAMLSVDADPMRCERLLRDALAIARRGESPGAEGLALGNLGWLAKERGRLDEAERWYRDALAVHREVGNRRSEANSLLNLGGVWQRAGRVADARATLELAVARHEALGDRAGEGRCLIVVGELVAKEGADPTPWLERALALFREVGHLALQQEVERRMAQRRPG
ncbi:MAG: tetratricopeptide repeat protein, partial [Myxococcota bacterium]